MFVKVITAPTEEPITPDDVKQYARIDVQTEDTLIASMITAAREYGENITGRAWVSRTMELVLDAFPDHIVLPYPPVSSVTSVKYYDTTNVEQTLSAAEYEAETDSELPARIKPAYGYTWPSTYSMNNAVRVRYVCGYGTADQVPEALKGWLRLRVSSMYELRDAVVVGQNVSVVPRDFVDGILDPYRIWYVSK